MLERAADPMVLHPGLRDLPRRYRQALREAGQEDTLLPFAWELAQLPPDLEDAPRRDFFALALALLAAEGQGHVRMSLASREDDAAWAFLRACGHGDLEVPALLARPSLAPLAGPPGASHPLIQDGGWLYLFRLHRAETRLAQGIQRLRAAAPGAPLPPPEAIFTHPVTLSQEQREAVARALERPLTLITGGPGTGKTSIVVALLRAFLRQPGAEAARVALAAPTGKAAQRMGEAIRKALEALAAPSPEDERLRLDLPEPRTLHRLLGWHPGLGRFQRDEAYPLDAGIVIVDEASMVSLDLLDQLARALGPEARLVLLGDADQLPSVEAGCAFRDLVQGLPDAVQRLTESYRMRSGDPAGRRVLQAAQALQRGEVPGEDLLPARSDASELRFEGIERLEGDPHGALERWFREVAWGDPGFQSQAERIYRPEGGAWAPEDQRALESVFRSQGRARILCLLNDTGDARSVEGLNALFHRWMQARTGQGLRGEAPFYAGEPVLMTVNDPRRGLFNGDVGVVLKVVFGDEIRQAAVFPSLEGPRAFPVEALRGALQLCHAMTVHKAQGSEFEQVLILLPEATHPALSREVLYTALTRAKRSVVLLGGAEALAQGVSRPERRASGLGERLG